MKKVRLFCCTHDLGSEQSEVVEAPDNATEEELNHMAEEFYQDSKEPEWWFEELSDDDDAEVGEQ